MSQNTYRRDRHHIDSERGRVENSANRWRTNEKTANQRNRDRRKDDDENDFETYAYEYRNHNNAKMRTSGEGRTTTHESPTKSYSPERYDKRQFLDRDDYRENRKYQTRYPPGTKLREVSREKALLDLAATKIQAAFRGYITRKIFWRQLEYQRGLQNSAHAFRQDEISIPSVTSIVDSSSVSALSANADPNLGLTAPLPTLDSLQKNQIIRNLKSKLNFSDEISSVYQLQTETSPTVVVLGGINPLESGDYILGGSIFVYNVKKDKWYFGGTLPEPRNYHGAVYLNGKIYITGGYSSLQVYHGQMVASQSLFQLSVRSKRWRRRADMHQARACHGTCITDENIMVVGGRDNSGKLLSTVELYYPKRDQWILVKPMPEAIMGMGCAVMDGCVWVVGGIVNEGHSSKYTVSNRVYAFDTQQQSWLHKPSLPEGRAYCSAASLKREIWLWCGVKDSLNEEGYLMSTNTVFVFNPEIMKWEHHSTIGTAKHGTAVAKFGRRVYLLGGMSNVTGSKEVLNENDYYNRENDKFTEGAPLPRPITGTAAVALPIDYIATSDPKWNYENVNDLVLNEAATKIQAVYRGHRTRSLISNNKFPIYPEHSGTHKRIYEPQGEPYSDKWKLFQRVQIDDWPPTPDPKAVPSELNVRLGTLPKGYTVTAASAGGRTKVRRYVTLPEDADPNLGMCGYIGSIYKKTKKILGLRKVEHMPSFARDMTTVSVLQDDSFPVVLLLGGLQPREPVNLTFGKLIMLYHPLKNHFEYFGVLPEPRNYHAAIYYREFIYVTGGCDPDKINCGEMVSTKTVYSLNIHSSEWVQKADMKCCRSHHSLVAYQDRLYAIGGRDHNGRLVASIEAYDIESDEWKLKRPMSSPRMGMACVVFDHHIWCLGGIGLSEETQAMTFPVLASVVSYDLVKDAWLSRPPLRCPRVYATCVVVQGAMWLFGGASKDPASKCLISMASVDKYYAKEAQWMRRTLLSTPRHAAAVVSVESCVYVFGGVTSQEWSALCKNEMVVIDDISLHTFDDLPLPLTGLAAVVIPPVLPSLRPESVALLLHRRLTEDD